MFRLNSIVSYVNTNRNLLNKLNIITLMEYEKLEQVSIAGKCMKRGIRERVQYREKIVKWVKKKLVLKLGLQEPNFNSTSIKLSIFP